MRDLHEDEFDEAMRSIERYGYWVCEDCGNKLEPDSNCEECGIKGPMATMGMA